jgi:hypothetical protein
MKVLFAILILFLSGYFSNFNLEAQSVTAIRLATGTDKSGQLINNGKKYTFEGVLFGPTIGIPGYYNVTVYDSTGAITISMNLGAFNLPKIGDSVRVSGHVVQILNNGNSGTTVLTDTITFVRIGKSSNNENTPFEITKLSEEWESKYIQLDSVRIVNPSDWHSGGIFGYSLIPIIKNADTIFLRISNSVFNQVPRPPVGRFNVRGIVFQNDIYPPYLEQYRIGAWDQSNFDFLETPPLKQYSISQVNSVDSITGKLDSFGLRCILKAVVSSHNLSASINQQSLFIPIEDSTGSIFVYNPSSNFGNNFSSGDSIEIYGMLDQFWGLSRFIPDSIILINTGNPTVQSIEINLLNEAYEARLVKLNRVFLTSPKQWDTSSRYNKQSFTVFITSDGTDSFPLQINRSSSLYYSQAPKGFFDLTAFESQSDFGSPYLQNYYLISKDSFDVIASSFLPEYKIGEVKVNDNLGNNIAARQKLNCLLKGVVQSTNIDPQDILFSLADKTGAICIHYLNSNSDYIPEVGDSIQVRGTIMQKDGFTYFEARNIIFINKGNRTYRPGIISYLMESDESLPRKIENVKLIDTSLWRNNFAPGGFAVKVIDSIYSDTFNLWISNVTGISAINTPLGYFNITGIILQKDKSQPYFDNYYLAPWSIQNFEFSNATAINYLIQEKSIKPYPNPFSDKINLNVQENGILEIYSSNGKFIESVQIYKNSNLITLQDIKPGIYFARFTGASSTFVNLIEKR